MKITPAFLDELRTRLSLADIVGRRVKLQKKGRDHLGLCPFHNEKTPSFSVSEDKGFYHCFGCQAHGDVIDFVQKLEGLTFPETVEKLAAEAGLEVPQGTPEDRRREEKRQSLAGAMEAACRWFERALAERRGDEARRYLAARGLDEATVARFRLGYAPDGRSALKTALTAEGFEEAMLVEAGLLIRPPDGDRASYDRFRGRVMFPIMDRRGRVIAFGGRLLGDGEPKYLNSPETPLFHKGATLYHLDKAAPAARKDGRLVVAEGYMDVIALVRAGFEGAVAPLGTAITEDQIQALWKIAPEPILCLDGDGAGRRAALRAAERALPLLMPGRSLRFALLPEGEDPDSLLRGQGAGGLGTALDAALPLSELLWQAERHAAPLDTPERQADLKARLYGRARQVANATVRDLYIADFRRRLDDLFRPRPRFADGLRGGYRGRGAPPPPTGLRAAHNTDVLDLRQQQALLAAVINHPDLVEDAGEALGTVDLSVAELDRLRREILKTWHSSLDSKGLESHLRQGGFAGVVDKVLANNVYVLAPFARPDADAETVRRGWHEALTRLRRRQHGDELLREARQLGETMTGEAWARFDALRRMVGEDDGDDADWDRDE